MALRPVGRPHGGWATSLPRLPGDANSGHRPRLCRLVHSVWPEIRCREYIISTYSPSLRLSTDQHRAYGTGRRTYAVVGGDHGPHRPSSDDGCRPPLV